LQLTIHLSAFHGGIDSSFLNSSIIRLPLQRKSSKPLYASALFTAKSQLKLETDRWISGDAPESATPSMRQAPPKRASSTRLRPPYAPLQPLTGQPPQTQGPAPAPVGVPIAPMVQNQPQLMTPPAGFAAQQRKGGLPWGSGLVSPAASPTATPSSGKQMQLVLRPQSAHQHHRQVAARRPKTTAAVPMSPASWQTPAASPMLTGTMCTMQTPQPQPQQQQPLQPPYAMPPCYGAMYPANGMPQPQQMLQMQMQTPQQQQQQLPPAQLQHAQAQWLAQPQPQARPILTGRTVSSVAMQPPSRAASTTGSVRSGGGGGGGGRQWNSHFAKPKPVAARPPAKIAPPRETQSYRERLQRVALRSRSSLHGSVAGLRSPGSTGPLGPLPGALRSYSAMQQQQQQQQQLCGAWPGAPPSQVAMPQYMPQYGGAWLQQQQQQVAPMWG